MILDANVQLANLFAPTAQTANLCTTTIDTDALADWGAGTPWIWYVEIPTAFTTGTSATLSLQLVGHATDPQLSGASTILTTVGLVSTAVSTWALGFELKFPIPRAIPGTNQSSNNYRYLGLQATIGTGTMTAGKINSWITPAVQDNRSYASGYTVL